MVVEDVNGRGWAVAALAKKGSRRGSGSRGCVRFLEGVERGGNSRENAAALRLAGWLARGVRVDVGMAMPADIGAELGLAILRVGADGLVPWARRCAYSASA